MERKTRDHGFFLTVAAIVTAALLACAMSYSVAKYVIAFDGAAAETETAFFGVTSEIRYRDRWSGEEDYVEAEDGGLGAMMPKEDGTIDFVLTVTNGSDVPVYCVITLDGNYYFTFSDGDGYTLSDSETTLTTDTVPAAKDGEPGTAEFAFTVHVWDWRYMDTSSYPYSGLLEMKITYAQAGEA